MFILRSFDHVNVSEFNQNQVFHYLLNVDGSESGLASKARNTMRSESCDLGVVMRSGLLVLFGVVSSGFTEGR